MYADNLKCVSTDPAALLRAARFTVRLVGQELATRKCVLLSTSRIVRSDMRDWVVTDEGDRWSVKLDVRDLGFHLDSTFRGWAATLATRVRLVAGLRKLPAAIVRIVWSRRQSLANPGVVLSLLDGPAGCDPAFRVVWFQFRMFCRFLAYRPGEVARVKRLLEHVAAGCPGHGPVHLLVESAAEIDFLS